VPASTLTAPRTEKTSPLDAITIVLASASPRRRTLLERAGVALEVVPALHVDEAWAPPEHPVTYTRRLALAKAREVASGHPGRWVLGADTTVWSDPVRGPLAKPDDAEHARAMIEHLVCAGRHLVTTAYALVRSPADGANSARVHRRHVTTEVWMRTVSPGELDAYVNAGDWRDKAGGYGIQSDAEGFVREIVGSYTNVVGLPLAEVIEDLTAVTKKKP